MNEHNYYDVINDVALQIVKINSMLIAANMPQMMYTCCPGSNHTLQYTNAHNKDTLNLMHADIDGGIFTTYYKSLQLWHEHVNETHPDIANEINDCILTPLRQIYYDVTNIDAVCSDLHRKWLKRGKSFK
jgi:hypothetical protein